MAARHEEGGYEKNILKHFFACKGLSNSDVGAATGTVFQEIRAGVGFKTGVFVKEKFGGATIERLRPKAPLSKPVQAMLLPWVTEPMKPKKIRKLRHQVNDEGRAVSEADDEAERWCSLFS